MTTLPTTNVPQPTFGPTGFVAPSEPAILAGVQLDQNQAFGGNLNPSLTTPQGQLAQSLTAIIGDCNNQFLALANGVDPSYATGRMQDAIGRIYFMTRIPATATVVSATCNGAIGTTIPVGATAIDNGGNIYSCIQAGIIPSSGSIILNFQCNTTGPISCPIGYLATIYQTIAGWSTITNLTAGTIGNNVESSTAFELRRQQSVGANAQGTLPSVISAVFNVPGVTDAFASQNGLNVTSGAIVTGSISGTTMTITAVISGTLAVGQMVTGSSVLAGTLITAITSGATLTGSISGNILTVTAIGAGAVSVGQSISGTGILTGTTITGLGTGTGGTGTYAVNLTQVVTSTVISAVGGTGGYTVNQTQTVGSGSLTCAVGGVPLLANSIYVCVYGGAPQAIANAIWANASAGCQYNGNTVVSVQDSNSGYNLPYPTYNVAFQTPTPTPILFAVSMQSNAGVPANATALIQAAIAAAFNGTDGGSRARIGSVLFASRYYQGITALGSWAVIYSVQLGIISANLNSLQMQINQVPTLSTINVTFS